MTPHTYDNPKSMLPFINLKTFNASFIFFNPKLP